MGATLRYSSRLLVMDRLVLLRIRWSRFFQPTPRQCSQRRSTTRITRQRGLQASSFSQVSQSQERRVSHTETSGTQTRTYTSTKWSPVWFPGPKPWLRAHLQKLRPQTAWSRVRLLQPLASLLALLLLPVQWFTAAATQLVTWRRHLWPWKHSKLWSAHRSTRASTADQLPAT